MNGYKILLYSIMPKFKNERQEENFYGKRTAMAKIGKKKVVGAIDLEEWLREKDYDSIADEVDEIDGGADHNFYVDKRGRYFHEYQLGENTFITDPLLLNGMKSWTKNHLNRNKFLTYKDIKDDLEYFEEEDSEEEEDEEDEEDEEEASLFGTKILIEEEMEEIEKEDDLFKTMSDMAGTNMTHENQPSVEEEEDEDEEDEPLGLEDLSSMIGENANEMGTVEDTDWEDWTAKDAQLFLDNIDDYVDTLEDVPAFIERLKKIIGNEDSEDEDEDEESEAEEISVDEVKIDGKTFYVDSKGDVYDPETQEKVGENYWGKKDGLFNSKTLKVLGLTEMPTKQKLKTIYRSLMRKHHPDKNPSADTTKLTQNITNAYRLLLEKYTL